METLNHVKQEDQQRERSLATLRQMVANKRAYEKEAIENYKNDPELQALIAKLRQENANRGTSDKL